MGFILENETASILARMKTIRKGFRAWNHPMLAHSRPNITHLATNFVSLSDSSETHLSTGRVRQTFASNGKRRAGRDGLGEVKGPRYTASTPPPRPRQLPLERAERTVPLVPSREAGT